MAKSGQNLKFKLTFNIFSVEKELLEELRQEFSVIFEKIKTKHKKKLRLTNKSIKTI